MWNRIGEQGGLILAPALTPDNKKISEFLGIRILQAYYFLLLNVNLVCNPVDLSLPMQLFEQLCRRDTGKKKKGKGGKGKKKK